MSYFDLLKPVLEEQGLMPTLGRRWLVTGAAGFIGSHLTEALLSLGQEVTALDDFTSGYAKNIEIAIENAALTVPDARSRLRFIEGSITDPAVCRDAISGVEFVLHEAARVSVPESIEEPASYNTVNITGFLNILEAARAENVQRVVYASSSAVYGDAPKLPKVESDALRCISPYALTKAVDEFYANLWSRLYGLECVGLRYFNIFGPRQDPSGAYAAVISKWIDAVVKGEPPVVYGDGSATRDFCPVCNVVLGNLLAALTNSRNVSGNVFNIACGGQTTLNELFEIISGVFAPGCELQLVRQPERAGDIPHSTASIARAHDVLGYRPIVSLADGLKSMKSAQSGAVSSL